MADQAGFTPATGLRSVTKYDWVAAASQPDFFERVQARFADADAVLPRRRIGTGCNFYVPWDAADPNGSLRVQVELARQCRALLAEEGHGGEWCWETTHDHGERLRLFTWKSMTLRLQFPFHGPIDARPIVDAYADDLIACGYFQISKRRGRLACLPVGMTGREALATVDADLAAQLSEAAAGDQYLRVHAPPAACVTVSPAVMAALRKRARTVYIHS